MSDSKDKKEPKYPPPAHLRALPCPDIPEVSPKKKRQQQESEKTSPLDWLAEADNYENPKPDPQKKVDSKDKGKTQDSGEHSGSLDWLFEADRYEPPKQPPKKHQ